MMKYDFTHIAGIINGKILQTNGTAKIEHLVLDSRRISLPETSLFFALTGPSRDGHEFLVEAFEKGVRNFVLSKSVDGSRFPHSNIILVNDSLAALQTLASWHRRQFSIPVIGITGSNGKTIVKEWLNQLLADEYVIVRSPKSYNSQIGVPLSIWQLNNECDLGIFEAGISQPGEMEKLERIIQPSIGIFTNIGEAHSEGFKNIQEKIHEKARLFENSTTIIYCSDSNDLKKEFTFLKNNNSDNEIQKKIFDWGYQAGAVLQIKGISKESDHSEISAIYREKNISIRLPFTDEASIQNAITCWLTLLYFEIPQNQIEERMLRLRPVSMRLELKKGINHCSIINDSYSADLSSLKIALDFLTAQQQHPKKTAILSDFLQSGMNQERLYSEIASLLKTHEVDRVIGIGETIASEKNKFAGIRECLFFDSPDHFFEHFKEIQVHNEAILLKGARVFEFERIDQLLAEKLHHTIFEINLNALAHNLTAFKRILEPQCKIMAMVKAFAYGSGSHEIANVLQFHKVDYLGVAYADEAVALRKAGIRLPIMVMNTEADSYRVLVEFNLEPVLYSLEILEDLKLFLKEERTGGISCSP